MMRKIKDEVKGAVETAEDLSKAVTESIKCPNCKGTGITGRIRKKPCKDCGGTGNIVGKIGKAIKEKVGIDKD